MATDLAEYRLRRQLRSVGAASMKPIPSEAGLDAVVVLMWTKVSSSTHLMIDPRDGARAVIRDTRLAAGRYLWSLLPAGEIQPMSEGRTDDLGQAKSIAQAALRAYAENQVTSRRGIL